MATLHLGCGATKTDGAYGVDLLPLPGVDLVHNLDSVPYPLDSGAYDKVIAVDVLEHLENFVGAIEEIYRVSKNGAEVVVTAPFALSVWRHHDPTHRRGLTSRSFDYFMPGTAFYDRYRYSKAKFELVQFGYSLNEKRGLLGRLMCKWANSYPTMYEKQLCYFYPMHNVFFILRVIK